MFNDGSDTACYRLWFNIGYDTILQVKITATYSDKSCCITTFKSSSIVYFIYETPDNFHAKQYVLNICCISHTSQGKDSVIICIGKSIYILLFIHHVTVPYLHLKNCKYNDTLPIIFLSNNDIVTPERVLRVTISLYNSLKSKLPFCICRNIWF